MRPDGHGDNVWLLYCSRVFSIRHNHKFVNTGTSRICVVSHPWEGLPRSVIWTFQKWSDSVVFLVLGTPRWSMCPATWVVRPWSILLDWSSSTSVTLRGVLFYRIRYLSLFVCLYRSTSRLSLCWVSTFPHLWPVYHDTAYVGLVYKLVVSVSSCSVGSCLLSHHRCHILSNVVLVWTILVFTSLSCSPPACIMEIEYLKCHVLFDVNSPTLLSTVFDVVFYVSLRSCLRRLSRLCDLVAWLLDMVVCPCLVWFEVLEYTYS